MIRPKLKKGDIDLATVYQISKDVWYKEKDDKKTRMVLDIQGAKLVDRRYFEYDRHTRQWKATGKRHIKFVFEVRSEPISYEKIDNIKRHKYPVYFIFYDIEKGWESPFRWRTGSFKRLAIPKKGSSKETRVKIAEKNIKNGVQPQFVFELMWVLNFWGLLYGPLTCLKKAPLKSNPKMWPFFDKHALACVEKAIKHIFTPEGISMIKGRIFK